MKTQNQGLNGILLIDKSGDKSSTDSLNIIKRNCNIKTIGHAGTLDPFATGLLIACVGKATKMINYFQGLFKVYEATLQLGSKTTTYDTEGEITDSSGIKVTLEDIQTILPKFKGSLSQKPPIYSALKVNGHRAYDLARKNIAFELESRQIEIQDLSIIHFNESTQELKLHIQCSKGTYIRSLAYDMGESLKCFAYVKALRRVQIGSYHVNDATPDMMVEREDIIPITEFFKAIPKLIINPDHLKKVLNGARIEPEFILKDHQKKAQDQYKPHYYSIYSKEGVFIAIVDNQTHKPFYIDQTALEKYL